jgi:aminoglycoside 6'-N-acetyltransferase
MPSPHARPTLTGPRVVLRPLTRADAPALLAILAHPDVERWWGRYDAEKLKRDFYAPGWCCALVVELAGEIAGVVHYHEEDDPDYKRAQVDILIAGDRQEQGLGTESLRMLAAWLIDERGHHRITMDPAVDNARAIHVYGKVGFRPIGVARQYERGADGQWHDALLMELIADEFVRS